MKLASGETIWKRIGYHGEKMIHFAMRFNFSYFLFVSLFLFATEREIRLVPDVPVQFTKKKRKKKKERKKKIRVETHGQRMI